MTKLVQNYCTPKLKAKIARSILVAGIATAMSFGSVQSASANDPVGDFIHTIECIGLLITDEEKHLEECGTNDNVVEPLVELPTVPVASPPPPPPPETESESESSPQ